MARQERSAQQKRVIYNYDVLVDDMKVDSYQSEMLLGFQSIDAVIDAYTTYHDISRRGVKLRRNFYGL